MNKNDKIIIAGAAGLVGQNLTTCLVKSGYANITALDKNSGNLAILRQLHPQVKTICADLSVPGDWADCFAGAQRLFLLQARITADTWEPFRRDTLDSTALVLAAARQNKMPFTVFVSSSVVNSVSDDHYTRSKKAQEEMMAGSGLPCCVARPTLMFGWFDPKHLGWLSRFMAKVPVFPIPGHGRYIRQPLYVIDFCKVLIWCAENTPEGKIYDIVGEEDITYVDIIRAIKRVKKISTPILPLPVPLFRFILKAYGLISKNPPFVADQLEALMAGDYFSGDGLEKNFGFSPTPFSDALLETFTDPVYSAVVLERGR
jgi:nucleoside-diphosphate-sugar epimerase